MRRTVVLNVVGLTPGLLGPDTPNLNQLAGARVPLDTVTPAVTCTVQASLLTGLQPRDHGIVANGWYFHELDQVWLWRQSERLVQGEQIWDTGRRRDPGFTSAKTFWWYAQPTGADWSVTPKPVYTSDGRKLPDCASDPPYLREQLTRRFGAFPLFEFWGPATTIRSSEWIAEAALMVDRNHQPTLQVVYLPHLDYVLQKKGPRGDVRNDLREIDAVCGRLIEHFTRRRCRVVVLSEYGITPVRRAVHPNRALRKAGLLALKEDLGREYLDTSRSPAFVVSDHQVAHVYVRSPRDLPRVQEVLSDLDGVERVLDADGKREHGLDHPRSGELVLLAEPDAWFTYYFWLDDARAPDYARTVDIHQKPGYDPCELFFDPALRFPKLSAAWVLAKRKLGLRSLMELTPLDPSLVRGSHGRITERDVDGPLLMTTEPRLLQRDRIAATEVRDLLLDHVFVE